MNEESPSTALTVTARAALALGSDKVRTELAELVAKSANILEVKNTAGREECHSAAMALVRARTTITKTGKAAREDAAAFQKAVIAAEKDLIAITQGEEDRLLALRDKWDADRAAEKAEAERIERARITAIHERIAAIRAYADRALQAKTAAAAAELIELLVAESIEGFEEFDAEAINARGLTLARMAEIHDTKLAEEKERARVAAEQEATRKQLAEEREALARQQAEARAAQAEADAKAKAEREAAEAKLAADRAAFQAEQDRQREAQAAEARRLAALADDLARQHAETAAALAAATNIPAPLQQAMNDVVEMLAPAPATPPAAPQKPKFQRPTDVQIVEAIARHYCVPAPVALSWLIDVDIANLLDVYEGEVA